MKKANFELESMRFEKKITELSEDFFMSDEKTKKDIKKERVVKFFLDQQGVGPAGTYNPKIF